MTLEANLFSEYDCDKGQMDMGREWGLVSDLKGKMIECIRNIGRSNQDPQMCEPFMGPAIKFRRGTDSYSDDLAA